MLYYLDFNVFFFLTISVIETLYLYQHLDWTWIVWTLMWNVQSATDTAGEVRMESNQQKIYKKKELKSKKLKSFTDFSFFVNTHNYTNLPLYWIYYQAILWTYSRLQTSLIFFQCLSTIKLKLTDLAKIFIVNLLVKMQFFYNLILLYLYHGKMIASEKRTSLAIAERTSK